MAGLASVWAMARRRPKEYRRKMDAATRCFGVFMLFMYDIYQRSKATSLDRVYGPAWLAFGHSFAVENEHDQAMAAYFTAAQLMKG